jgi:GTP pyrophosphokinase
VDPEFEIKGRLKSSESASFKHLRNKNSVRAIHDKVGVRVTVQDIEQCFATVACLHHVMPYLEHLYDDYITHPKENGYQSLHTTLIAANGWPFEVQVRTHEMHEHAEWGAASHQAYKEALVPEPAPKSQRRVRSDGSPCD